jgi:pentapeptide MXKDX repeat protein
MKKQLIMLALVSSFGLQQFAYAQQDTTKKQKKTHKNDTLKRDTTKKDTLKKIKP